MRTLPFKLSERWCFFQKRCYWYRKGYSPSILEPGVYHFPKRQVPECGRKSLDDRLKDLAIKPLDMASLDPVDIGLPYKPLSHQQQLKQNFEMESKISKESHKVSLETVYPLSEDTDAPQRRLSIAKHYDIFNALFGPPHFFVPVVHFKLEYPYPDNDYDHSQGLHDTTEEHVYTQPVYSGNFISPSLSMRRPWIDLTLVPESHNWTLVMTCPDEPVGADGREPAREYIHWMVANINVNSANDVLKGDEIIPYLPPLPYEGSGYHRYIFVLYQQLHGVLDLNQWKRESAKGDLYNQREFSTLDFYRSLQSELTPAGLAFFQSSWDESVRHYYRHVLDTLEPVFELEWPDDHLPPQEKFPEPNWWNKPRRHPHGIPLIRQRYGAHNDVSFDVYLDRYRDRKELFEEIVCERLAIEGNPLDVNEPQRHQYEYPAAVKMPENMPSWWQKQEMKRRLRQGRWRHLNGHDG